MSSFRELRKKANLTQEELIAQFNARYNKKYTAASQLLRRSMLSSNRSSALNLILMSTLIEFSPSICYNEIVSYNLRRMASAWRSGRHFFCLTSARIVSRIFRLEQSRVSLAFSHEPRASVTALGMVFLVVMDAIHATILAQ